eukprot:11024444-Lingulodinium_polyedra.AAC.1
MLDMVRCALAAGGAAPAPELRSALGHRGPFRGPPAARRRAQPPDGGRARALRAGGQGGRLRDARAPCQPRPAAVRQHLGHGALARAGKAAGRAGGDLPAVRRGSRVAEADDAGP